ncbi:single-stranded-DNA-specific exonuclease RecJ [Acinetobacter nectaris]|uniref:single-stranded-DNA-specific exonuclease RecJ n=1 Tax=Acinetobacter nectaris TaxID=1219382 RepID=UPI001F017A97|nr:single-stranded-DNA-specific exonuclease RecJ [Acinetobacter nectaris]MCF9046164.1 single-stranded-DNA-specific exonuclease RecJ [Acinetobacter nectaris]
MSILHIRQRPIKTSPDTFLGLSPFMANILARREIQSASELELKLPRLLKPTLKGLESAVTLLNDVIESQQKVVIVGDYDADGATSTAIMVLVLRAINADVEYIVPDRFKYGYGLTAKIADLVQDTYQPHLLVTVDNGISSHEGVERAQSYGMKVIITDHHLTTKQLPKAEAVVNPNQLSCSFPSKALAGVGVAFYILASLMKLRKQQNKRVASVTQYLDLVALGTYADVATLDYNNRILIQMGLKQIQSGQCRAGILALLDVAGRDFSTLSAQDFGFVLGPRLNAAGRMDSMRIGIDCLLSNDFSEAYALARQLQQLNLERRQVETEMKEEALNALAQIQLDTTQLPSALVLFEPHWHQGVIGIVAGRLKEQFHRPSIVFAPDEDGIHIKGSARSVEGVHIRDMIEKVAETHPHLVRYFGGHAAAAGLTIEKKYFNEFKSCFEKYVSEVDTQLLEATIWTDGQLEDKDFNLQTIDDIEALGPWGQNFPFPVFEGAFDIVNYRWLKDKHLKLTLKLSSGQQLDAIAFNAFDKFEFNENKDQIYLVYTLDKNEFNGRVNLQLKIKHLYSL